MARLGTAIAADVEVVPGLGRDQADVLRLGLGALANAAGNGALDLVRGANAAVAFLDTHREADRILHAVAAPRGANTALDRPQGLAVGMPALEPGRDQFLPDIGQLVQLGTE